MESEEILKARQEKQTYICENVDPSLYEDFHDFCTTYAGQINIDAWNLSYVQQLVVKFKEFVKKKDQQADKHEKSFAIYQTTTGDNQISGSNSLQQINSLLQTLDQNPQARKKDPSPMTKKTPEIQNKNDTNAKPFAKKTDNSKQKNAKNQISALQLLKTATQEGEVKDTLKKQQNEKKNNSFFDTMDFWQVPKIEQPKIVKDQPKIQNQTLVQSPKNEVKTMKLNTNANELNINSGQTTPVNVKKIPEAKTDGSNKKLQQNEGSGKNIEAKRNEPQSSNNIKEPSVFDQFFNTNSTKTPNVPTNLQSEFDTFSFIADQQIKKKKSITMSVSSGITQNVQQRKKTGSIMLKQVRQLKVNKEVYKGPRVFQKQFTDQVSCVKVNSRPYLADQKLKIIQRSMFSSNYIMYNMHVIPIGRICKRNYEDFAKLKLTLEKFYPGIQMPYLEKEGWRGATSTQYAKKQGQMLEFFMGDILRNPELRNSRVIQQFLTLQEHKKIKRKFEQYDKMTKLKSIEQLCLLNGKVEVALTEKQRIYNENMGKFILKMQSNIQKYKKNYEGLAFHYNQSMAAMVTIDNVLEQILKDIENFNKTVTIRQIQNLDKSIRKMRSTCNQSFFRMRFQKEIVEQSILPFLRYQKQNTHVSKQIIELSNNLTSRYLKRMESETHHSSDSSYLSNAYNEYKNGILEQSKNITVLRYQVGFMQAQASSELHRIMDCLANKIDNLWKEIGGKYIKQLAKSAKIYSCLT